jgi:HSP20 family protein
MEGDNIFVELAKARTAPLTVKSVSSAPEIKEDPLEGQLMVDVFQDKADLVVQAALAGVKDADLEVHISNDSVTIRGSREKTSEIMDKDYFYQECFWGTFSRTVLLPGEVDPDKSVASLKNGILTVRMPKVAKSKAKKLRVAEE